MARYHKIGGWHGYSIPEYAVAGVSDTGTFFDSPCPSHLARAELKRIQKEVLCPAGIPSRVLCGRSSNVFCSKLWLVVKSTYYPFAKQATAEWLAKNYDTTTFVHDAA